MAPKYHDDNANQTNHKVNIFYYLMHIKLEKLSW